MQVKTQYIFKYSVGTLSRGTLFRGSFSEIYMVPRDKVPKLPRDKVSREIWYLFLEWGWAAAEATDRQG